jgi:hypothetical protein
VALTANDWLIATAVAATLLVAMELVKVIVRARRPAPASGMAGIGGKATSRA